jgi:hypothetical protein
MSFFGRLKSKIETSEKITYKLCVFGTITENFVETSRNTQSFSELKVEKNLNLKYFENGHNFKKIFYSSICLPCLGSAPGQSLLITLGFSTSFNKIFRNYAKNNKLVCDFL